MTNKNYARILERAYYLELLGEAVYQQRAKQRGNTETDKWGELAHTENRMRCLIHDELGRVAPVWKPNQLSMLAVRSLGFLSQLLGSRLFLKVIARVLDGRRYAAWAARVADQNPTLWRELIEHEEIQVQHVQTRRGG